MQIEYEIMAPIGTDVLKKQGTLVDLFLALGTLWGNKLIPPLFILNQVLEKGIYDMGMSGGYRWEAFRIEEDDYRKFVQGLIRSAPTLSKNYEEVETPAWVQSLDDWGFWVGEYVYGVPVAGR